MFDSSERPEGCHLVSTKSTFSAVNFPLPNQSNTFIIKHTTSKTRSLTSYGSPAHMFRSLHNLNEMLNRAESERFPPLLVNWLSDGGTRRPLAESLWDGIHIYLSFSHWKKRWDHFQKSWMKVIKAFGHRFLTADRTEESHFRNTSETGQLLLSGHLIQLQTLLTKRSSDGNIFSSVNWFF